METRLLIHRITAGVVTALSMETDMSDVAVLVIGGASVTTEVLKADGETVTTHYAIPNVNQCTTRHQANLPIGPKAGFLNKPHQYGETRKTS